MSVIFTGNSESGWNRWAGLMNSTDICSDGMSVESRNGPIADRDSSQNDQMLAQFSGINVRPSSSLAKLDLGLAGRSVVWFPRSHAIGVDVRLLERYPSPSVVEIQISFMNCRPRRPCDFPLNCPANSIALSLIWQVILALIASLLIGQFAREILCPGLLRRGF